MPDNKETQKQKRIQILLNAVKKPDKSDIRADKHK